MRVSWKHEHTEFQGPLKFERKVELFYEQTLGWQLHIANLIANSGMTFAANGGRPSYQVPAIEHSGFAVLHICLSYFELVGSIILPNTKKQKKPDVRFKAGVEEVFSDLFKSPTYGKKLATRLYNGARNGLYHAGRTRQRVGLGSPADGAAMEYNSRSDYVTVSPGRLPRELVSHLERFRDRLLNHAEVSLRAQFQGRFDEDFT